MFCTIRSLKTVFLDLTMLFKDTHVYAFKTGDAFNPLKPHDASKHHFAYLKNDSISSKPMGFFNGTVI